MSYERFASLYPVAAGWKPSTSAQPSRSRLRTIGVCFMIGMVIGVVAAAIARAGGEPDPRVTDPAVKYSDAAADPVRLATVKIVNGCSGVCVSPAGIVMTAKHCDEPEKVRVKFPALKREVDAVRVYVSEESEGPVVFDCEGDGYPCLPVSAMKPEIGDRVRGIGYPGLDETNYVVMSGSITGGAMDGSGVRYNETDFQAMKGMSGGPLINDRNEVIGLLTGGDGRSTIWISHQATRQAYDVTTAGDPQPATAPAAGRPKLIAFTAPFCTPCQLAENDVRGDVGGLATLVRTYFDWTIVKATLTGWDRPEAARAFVVATGLKEVPGAPTFWIEGTPHYLTGYSPTSGNRNLQAFLRKFIPQQPPAADTTPAAAQVDAPETAPAPIPEPQPEIDWTGAKVVLLLARQDLGTTGDAIARAALEMDHSLLRRRFNELTGGRGSIEIVAERTRPTRFAAVTQALQVDVDKFHVALLVKQQEIGMLRGVGVKLAGRLLEGLTTTEVPLSIVSERVHPTPYQLVSDALIVPEPASDAPAGEEDLPWWYGLVAAVVGLFKRRFLKEQPNE